MPAADLFNEFCERFSLSAAARVEEPLELPLGIDRQSAAAANRSAAIAGRLNQQSADPGCR